MKCKHHLFYASASTVLLALSPLCSLSVLAQLPIEGTTSGVFVNPVPISATTTGVGTNNFTFGASSPTVNRFTFAAVPFNTQTGNDFLLGTFTYVNGATVAGTTIDFVDLQIGLNFTTPSVGLQTSSFSLNSISTLNVGTPNENADFVLLPSSFSPSVFTLSDTQYTLQLLGFRNVMGDGFLTSTNMQLHVREDSRASAQLFGRVTSDLTGTPTTVPEPSSILSLIGTAISALLLRRKWAW
jgi:hypothetical protein